MSNATRAQGHSIGLALPGSTDCGVSCRRRALGTEPQRKRLVLTTSLERARADRVGADPPAGERSRSARALTLV